LHDCVDILGKKQAPTSLETAYIRARKLHDRMMKSTATWQDDPGVKAMLIEAADDIRNLERLLRLPGGQK